MKTIECRKDTLFTLLLSKDKNFTTTSKAETRGFNVWCHLGSTGRTCPKINTNLNLFPWCSLFPMQNGDFLTHCFPYHLFYFLVQFTHKKTAQTSLWVGGPAKEPQVQNQDVCLLLPWILCLLSKTRFHTAQASSKLDMYLRLFLNYSSSCFYVVGL